MLAQTPHGCMHDFMVSPVGVVPNLSQELRERPGAYRSLSQAKEKFEVASAWSKDLAPPTHFASTRIDHKIALRLDWRPHSPFSMWILHVCRSEYCRSDAARAPVPKRNRLTISFAIGGSEVT